ncbi:MAG TPA: alanine racemase [Acidimicrobiales bacterium]|nr:alanine racemase [Acidimicrobiales bacterium]
MSGPAGSAASTGVGTGADVYRVRPAWAEVDLAAIRHNASVLAAWAAPARLCAVVKAGGYGHGAAEVAHAALAGGAAWLAVALVEEGRELRQAGITAPVLVLSEPPADAMSEVVAAALTPTIYTAAGLAALRRAAVASAAAGASTPFPVHVKVDTGMHRVGAAPGAAVALAAEVAADPALALEGFWTHLAVSDEVDHPFNDLQFDRYDIAVNQLAETGVRPAIRHASNSGGALWHPRGRYDMVRCGIALYGLAPAASGPPHPELRPAMSLKARVSYAKEVAAGERLSYGLRYELPEDSVVVTVPLGYADGIPRRLSAAGGHVLIGGRRRPLAGTVTMDQILVDCGPGAAVQAGDEVVLIGRQGEESIGAWEWAVATDTIAYEVVCGISGRVPRIYIDGSWHRPGA